MNGILVVVDHLESHLTEISNELIGAAIALSQKGLGTVAVALISGHPERLIDQLCLANVDVVYRASVASDHFDPSVYEAAVLGIAKSFRPALILSGHSINSMTYAPAIAAKLGCGFATDVFDITVSNGGINARRAAYGNKVESTLSFPSKAVTLLTVRGGSFPLNSQGDPNRYEDFEVLTTWEANGVTHLGYERPPQSDVDISKSEIILSVGRGIQDEANIPRFRQLAARIGATFGCSRPLVDAGWLPKAHQVGQSGKVATNCKLYLALGISGAVQHLHGMKHVGTIVAVNTDPHAPIFNAAKYGINMDIFEFADALEREFPKEAP